MSTVELRDRYADAVERLAQMAASDATLIGFYVYGSAHRGDVWKHSDIDCVFVSADERRQWQAYQLVEDGIHVSAEVCSRSHFRRIQERSLRGSVIHSIFTSGRLVYSEDPALQDYLDEANSVAQRDLELLRMDLAIRLGGALDMAEKALVHREDALTGFHRIFNAFEHRSLLVLLEHDELLCRDAISRACSIDSELSRLWDRAAGSIDCIPALLEVHEILANHADSRAEEHFKPLIDYLREERAVRAMSEIYRAIGERLGQPDMAHHIGMACDALAEKGVIERTTVPVRLTRKGQVEFEEAAFFYGGER